MPKDLLQTNRKDLLQINRKNLLSDKFLTSDISTKKPKYQQLLETTATVLDPTKEIPKIAEDPKTEATRLGKAVGETILHTGQLAGGALAPGYAATRLGTQGIAKLAPIVASGLTTTPITQFAIEKLRGKPTKEAIKEAGYATAGDIGFSGLTGGLGAAARKALPNLGDILAGVPKRAVTTALEAEKEGRSIFKKMYDYDKLALKTQSTMNRLTSEAGAAVNVAKQKLFNIKKTFNVSDLKQFIDDEISNHIHPKLGYKISDEAMNNLKNLSENFGKIKDNADIDALFTLKNKIADISNFKKEGLVKITDKEEVIFRKIGKQLSNKINFLASDYNIPELANANKKYSEAMKLKENLLPLISKDASVGEKLYTLTQKQIKETKPIIAYEKELKSLAPKLRQEYLEALASEQFKKNLPQGRGEFLFGGLAAAVTAAGLGRPGPLAAFIPMAVAMSPKFYKAAIKTIGKPMSPITRGAGKKAAITISDILTNQGANE